MSGKKAVVVVVLFLCVFVTGCIPGKTYRAKYPSEEVPPLPRFGGAEEQLPPGPLCNIKNAGDFKTPCMSYIELDDLGELRVAPGDLKLPDREQNAPTQLSVVLSLIRAAMKPVESERSQPIIMVFVHGWKHNAQNGNFEDPNVQGQKDFLDLLKDRYPDEWIDAATWNRCKQGADGCVMLRHPVVGIYIGWRGDTISHYFAVSRQFTYFDREATAYRVGGTSLTFVLSQISALAHPAITPDNPHPKLDEPFLLMMGHSFGGLVLEKALQQALTERLDEGVSQKSTFADLIVLVNTAMAASDSKQMIDLLAVREGRRGTLNPPESGSSKRYPMIVSLSSATDQATLSAIFFGHGLTALKRNVTGGNRKPDPLFCYEPETQTTGIIRLFSQTDFYMHTAPHFEALQSHELKAFPQAQCKALEEMNPNLPASRLSDSFGPTESMDGTCYAVVPKNSKGGAQLGEAAGQRCNGTPYFVMEVPHEIIPDHGTIFTLRHWQLLTLFLNTTSENAGRPTQQQRGLIRLSGAQVR
jgi:hypothetical protein